MALQFFSFFRMVNPCRMSRLPISCYRGHLCLTAGRGEAGEGGVSRGLPVVGKLHNYIHTQGLEGAYGCSFHGGRVKCTVGCLCAGAAVGQVEIQAK